MISTETNRRDFLKTTSIATSGLMMGVVLPGTVAETMAAGTLHTPNAWEIGRASCRERVLDHV